MPVVTLDGALAFLAIAISLVVGWYAHQNTKNLDTVRGALEALREEYRILAFKYWEAVGDAAWLKRVLQMNNIEIPPTPDNYKPKTDKFGNISILMTTEGGVQVTGNARVSVGKNLSGRDQTVGGNVQEGVPSQG